MKRSLALALGLVLGLCAWMPQASAGLFFYPGDRNQMIYNNYESLFRPTGGGVAMEIADPFATPLVGDHLFGIMRVNVIENLTVFANNIPDTTAFTGTFAQRIATVTPLGPAGLFALTLANPTIFTFTDGATTVTAADLSTTEMFALYTEPVAGGTLFNPTGTLLSSYTTATDGSLMLTAGIDVANAANGASADLNLGVFAITSQGSLTFVTNNTGLAFSPILPISFAPLHGPGELVMRTRIDLNSISTSPWTFTSFDPAEVQPNIIPEPSSMLLIGMGLVGGAIRRRKKA